MRKAEALKKRILSFLFLALLHPEICQSHKPLKKSDKTDITQCSQIYFFLHLCQGALTQPPGPPWMKNKSTKT